MTHRWYLGEGDGGDDGGEFISQRRERKMKDGRAGVRGEGGAVAREQQRGEGRGKKRGAERLQPLQTHSSREIPPLSFISASCIFSSNINIIILCA